MTKKSTKFKAVNFADDNHTELTILGHRLEIREHLKSAMGKYWNGKKNDKKMDVIKEPNQ